MERVRHKNIAYSHASVSENATWRFGDPWE